MVYSQTNDATVSRALYGKPPRSRLPEVRISARRSSDSNAKNAAWPARGTRMNHIPFLLSILGILVPLAHLTGICFAVNAAMYARTSQGAIAWMLSLVFFPYLAVPLYLVFGRKKFHGYIEARRTGNRRIDHLAAHLVERLRPHAATLGEDAPRLAVFNRLALVPFTQPNTVRLLIDGDATFNAIFAVIETARSFLLVQFFIIRDDALGQKLAERLIAKSKTGVHVHLLYDEVGSFGLPRSYFARLRDGGVQVFPFNTRRGWRNRFQLNFRNHRKIVIADGHVAFIGGHNVGEEYLGKSPRFGHWRDTHVEIRGPAVDPIKWSFIEDWHWATGETLELPDCKTPPTPPDSAPPPDACTVTAIAIPTGPADDLAVCNLMFLAAISAAKKRLWITSPYFVPDEALYDALQLAALRGVDVRIMLPDKPDHLLVYLSSFSYLESGEHVGVKFYRYRSGFLHQKVMLVDDDFSAVGTANLDNRSLRLNFEITILCLGRDFAARTADMLEKDFAQCERIPPATWAAAVSPSTSPSASPASSPPCNNPQHPSSRLKKKARRLHPPVTMCATPQIYRQMSNKPINPQTPANPSHKMFSPYPQPPRPGRLDLMATSVCVAPPSAPNRHSATIRPPCPSARTLRNQS